MNIRSKRLVSSAGLAVFALLWVFPLLVLLVTSLKSPHAVVRERSVVVLAPTLANYARVLNSQEMTKGLSNSLLAASLTAALTLILATMAAYALARFAFKGRRALALLLLSLRMIPPVIIVIPLYDLLRRLRILDTHSGLVLVYLTLTLPLAIWLLLIFIREVPLELEEAAILDGCGALQVIWRVVLPAAAPGIATVGAFSFLVAWNEFTLALFLTDARSSTFTVAVAKLIELYRVPWGEVTAAAVMGLIPAIIFILVANQIMARIFGLGVIDD